MSYHRKISTRLSIVISGSFSLPVEFEETHPPVKAGPKGRPEGAKTATGRGDSRLLTYRFYEKMNSCRLERSTHVVEEACFGK
jgi:hypothetical protein